MSRPPTLSVIIPTYNRAALLRKTLESVYRQTFSDYEVVIVDDGSTDATESVVEEFLKDKGGQGERTRYIFQQNQGKSVALNRGLSEAGGEWIAFLDSDDFWLPDKIELQFQTLDQHAPQSQACFTDARFINNPCFEGTAFGHAGKHYSTATGVLADPLEFIGNPFWVFMQTILVHSRVMAKVGEFDPAFWTGQDEDFIFRLSLHTALCYVNAPLVLIDRTPCCQERLTEVRLRREYDTLKLRQRRYEKWLRLTEGVGGDIRTALREHLRGTHSEQANWLLANRRYAEARRAAGRAARTQCKPGILAKWCLTAVAPALARHLVVRRSQHGSTSELQAALLRTEVEDGATVSAANGSS